MQKLAILIIISCFSFYSECLAQDKIESEKRIKSEQVNSDARKLIETLFPETKVRWYLETNESGKQLEAKFSSSNKYSIEFTLEGELLDIEVLRDKNDIKSEILILIRDSVDSKQFKINRVQEQWSGEELLLKRALETENYQAGLHRNYEIELQFRQDGDLVHEEWLISFEGKLIRRRKILTPTLDNLIY